MKLAILDRDGVINQDSDSYIKGPDEWRPIPGSLEAIARLNHDSILVTRHSSLITHESLHHFSSAIASKCGAERDKRYSIVKRS